jgi:hypothetical protein
VTLIKKRRRKIGRIRLVQSEWVERIKHQRDIKEFDVVINRDGNFNEQTIDFIKEAIEWLSYSENNTVEIERVIK